MFWKKKKKKIVKPKIQRPKDSLKDPMSCETMAKTTRGHEPLIYFEWGQDVSRRIIKLEKRLKKLERKL